MKPSKYEAAFFIVMGLAAALIFTIYQNIVQIRELKQENLQLRIMINVTADVLEQCGGSLDEI